VSKVAVGHDTDGVVAPAEDPSEIRRDVEANLTTLGVSRLAAVNLRMMADAADEHFDAHLAMLVKLRDEGLIGGVGLSNVTRRQLLRAAGEAEIVCVQNLFNLADQRSLDVLTACTERNIAFVLFCPLGWPRGVQNQLLTALAARLEATSAQVALAWLLDLAPNILLIPGTRTRAHLTENLHAADVSLDDTARAALARHFPSFASEPIRCTARRGCR
jgi:aryl-alcohol dehydrogenase-like predicted oxidoreductase